MSRRDSRSYSPEQQEAAALAALDLSPEEVRPAPSALTAAFREVAAVVAEVAPSVPPPPSLKERLMSRVADYESLKPLADVRPHDGAWRSAGAPGVDYKVLFQDKQTRRTTMLLRMQPGANLPAHHHHDDEQCLVLRGDVRWRDLVYEEGDFVVMGRDTDHPEITSVHGNLLLLIAGHNEYQSAHE